MRDPGGVRRHRPQVIADAADLVEVRPLRQLVNVKGIRAHPRRATPARMVRAEPRLQECVPAGFGMLAAPMVDQVVEPSLVSLISTRVICVRAVLCVEDADLVVNEFQVRDLRISTPKALPAA